MIDDKHPEKSESEDFASMLAEFERERPDAAPQRRRTVDRGDKVTGRVVSIGRDAVFVDLGAKAEGSLDMEDLLDDDGNLTVAVGDEVEAVVASVGDTIALRRSFGRGGGAPAVQELEDAFNAGLPIDGLVASTNKGGFEVQVGNVRCFCPVSQIDSKFVEDPEQFVGRRYTFRVTKFEGGKRPNIVLSRRVLLEEAQRERAEQTLKTLDVGSTVTGTVSSLRDYGAFIDIGGIEGMLHISELDFRRVEHPSEVLSEGQQVEVQVIKIEETGNEKRPLKIGLSLKALKSDPWKDAVGALVEGSKVTGTVVRLQSFGAFVEILPGVEGLVHVSELGGGRRVNHPKEVVSVGDQVEVTILRIDTAEKRIGLSMDRQSDAEARQERREIEAHMGGGSSQSLGTFGDLLKKKLDTK